MSKITSLTTQYATSLIGVDSDPVRLTWQIEAASGAKQSEAEIQASADPSFSAKVAITHLTGADQIAVVAPGEGFLSREIRHYRVRSLVDQEWTEWTQPSTVEILRCQ